MLTCTCLPLRIQNNPANCGKSLEDHELGLRLSAESMAGRPWCVKAGCRPGPPKGERAPRGVPWGGRAGQSADRAPWGVLLSALPEPFQLLKLVGDFLLL